MELWRPIPSKCEFCLNSKHSDRDHTNLLVLTVLCFIVSASENCHPYKTALPHHASGGKPPKDRNGKKTGFEKS